MEASNLHTKLSQVPAQLQEAQEKYFRSCLLLERQRLAFKSHQLGKQAEFLKLPTEIPEEPHSWNKYHILGLTDSPSDQE